MDKQCKKCLKIKPLGEFYRHPNMADGRLNKCKDCTKADVNENREQNLDYYRNYDRKRYDQGRRPKPHPYHNKYAVAWYARNKHKKRANVILGRAIASGEVTRPDACSQCGNGGKIEGHHDDYSKPLEVTWLCTGCHGETRKKERKELQPRKRGGYKGMMLASRAI